jgi:hypothetical protein
MDTSSNRSFHLVIHGVNAVGSYLHPLQKVFSVNQNCLTGEFDVCGYTQLTTLCDKDVHGLAKIFTKYSDRAIQLRPITDGFLHQGRTYQRCYITLVCSASELNVLCNELKEAEYKFEVFDKFPWLHCYGYVKT